MNNNQNKKDIILCVLYFLAMLIILLFGCYIVIGALYLYYWTDVFFMEHPSFAPVPIVDTIAVIDVILIILAFIFYLIAPLGLTFAALMKKWSKYITVFFDNLLYLTLAVIATFIFWKIAGKYNDTLYEQFEKYIIPQVILIYVVFFVKIVCKKIKQVIRKN